MTARTTDLMAAMGDFEVWGRIYCTWQGTPQKPALTADCRVRYEARDTFNWDPPKPVPMLPGCDLGLTIWDDWADQLQRLSMVDPDTGRRLPMGQWRAMYFDIRAGWINGQEDPDAVFWTTLECPKASSGWAGTPAGAFERSWRHPRSLVPSDWSPGDYAAGYRALRRMQGDVDRRSRGDWRPPNDLWWKCDGTFFDGPTPYDPSERQGRRWR